MRWLRWAGGILIGVGALAVVKMAVAERFPDLRQPSFPIEEFRHLSVPRQQFTIAGESKCVPKQSMTSLYFSTREKNLDDVEGFEIQLSLPDFRTTGHDNREKWSAPGRSDLIYIRIRRARVVLGNSLKEVGESELGIEFEDGEGPRANRGYLRGQVAGTENFTWFYCVVDVPSPRCHVTRNIGPDLHLELSYAYKYLSSWTVIDGLVKRVLADISGGCS